MHGDFYWGTTNSVSQARNTLVSGSSKMRIFCKGSVVKGSAAVIATLACLSKFKPHNVPTRGRCVRVRHSRALLRRDRVCLPRASATPCVEPLGSASCCFLSGPKAVSDRLSCTLSNVAFRTVFVGKHFLKSAPAESVKLLCCLD